MYTKASLLGVMDHQSLRLWLLRYADRITDVHIAFLEGSATFDHWRSLWDTLQEVHGEIERRERLVHGFNYDR